MQYSALNDDHVSVDLRCNPTNLEPSASQPTADDLNRWIVLEFNLLVKRMHGSKRQVRFHNCPSAVWNEFCLKSRPEDGESLLQRLRPALDRHSCVLHAEPQQLLELGEVSTELVLVLTRLPKTPQNPKKSLFSKILFLLRAH